jgi:hypothetical protein
LLAITLSPTFNHTLRSLPQSESVDKKVLESLKSATLGNMRTCIPLILLATAIAAGCASVGSRKAERVSAYNALSARHRALVDEGLIDAGMDTNAVYIAWGKPYEIMRVDFPTGERTVWVYTAATSEQVSSWQYQPSGNPYSARMGTYNRASTTVLRRRTNGWVSFENGKVVTFDSYAPVKTR